MIRIIRNFSCKIPKKNNNLKDKKIVIKINKYLDNPEFTKSEIDTWTICKKNFKNRRNEAFVKM
jgi:hypothetical protein